MSLEQQASPAIDSQSAASSSGCEEASEALEALLAGGGSKVSDPDVCFFLKVLIIQRFSSALLSGAVAEGHGNIDVWRAGGGVRVGAYASR